MNQDTINLIIEDLIKDNDTIVVIPYGSRVYGTYTSESDWDFVVLRHDAIDKQINLRGVDFHFISLERFKELLDDHDVLALEVYYYLKQRTDNNIDIPFELDLVKLRKSISQKSNNSFVKFKKKLTLEDEDNYIGIKSLFHSLRIIQLGINIATNKDDVLETDVELFEAILDDAEKCNYDWECIHKIYKPIHNKLMSEFRIVAPKN
jgi:predicted nucleotidyltransferase